MTQYKINKENLASFVNSLIRTGKTVIAPRKKGDKVLFAEIDNFDQAECDYIQTVLSAKSVLFPRVEELFSYKLDGNNIPEIIQPILPTQEVVVFGLHPCDASSFDYVYDFFEKENPDFHVAARKEKTTLISLSCNKGDEYCICTSVGLSPADTKGSDIALTEIDGYYYVEVLTAQGEKLLSSNDNLFEKSEVIDKSKFTADIPLKFNLSATRENLDRVFDSDIWKEESLACLGCGACAFVCPTCTCFDIQDESNPYGGSRIRCWDTCGNGLFTLHASGHNPRPVQSQRWRQRLMHKLEYSVENLDSVSCVGCGRCARNCPAEMNIIEHIISLQEA